jgi:hypothetical protein
MGAAISLQFEQAYDEAVRQLVGNAHVYGEKSSEDGVMRTMVVGLPDGQEATLKISGMFTRIEPVTNADLELFLGSGA